MKSIVKQKYAMMVIDLWTPRIQPFCFTFTLRKWDLNYMFQIIYQKAFILVIVAFVYIPY